MPDVVNAPAKLTLSLRITGVREDGYHLIDAEMVALELHDVLLITEGASGLSVSGPYAAEVPTDHTNLAAKALELVGRQAHLHIDKRIPHGGGLGGGSADAAAVLRWAGVTDNDIATRLGADVPFCLAGGRARVTGIGDVLAPLPSTVQDFTLVIPPITCATVAVYRTWDGLGGPAGDNGNDLEPAAIRCEPELARWRDRIAEATGIRPRLAGSGATWFLEGRHADRLAERAWPAAVIETSSRAT